MQAGDDIYHPKCFTCLVCERPFLDRESIRKDEWGGMVHTQHFRQALSCGSCGRLFSKKKHRQSNFSLTVGLPAFLAFAMWLQIWPNFMLCPGESGLACRNSGCLNPKVPSP